MAPKRACALALINARPCQKGLAHCGKVILGTCDTQVLGINRFLVLRKKGKEGLPNISKTHVRFAFLELQQKQLLQIATLNRGCLQIPEEILSGMALHNFSESLNYLVWIGYFAT